MADSSAETPKTTGGLDPQAIRFHQVMDEVYRRPETYPGSIDPEAGRFIYSLVRLVRPALAVEVGTHFGVSTLWIARGIADNGIGKLLALDLFIAPPLEDVRSTIERAGLADQVAFVRGASTTTGADACRREGRPIDFLLIDGDHRVEGCAADFETLGALVRPGGYVVLHDIYPELCGWDGPRYVLDFLNRAGHNARGWEILEVPTAPLTPFGLAILRRVNKRSTRILPRPAYWIYQIRKRLIWKNLL